MFDYEEEADEPKTGPLQSNAMLVGHKGHVTKIVTSWHVPHLMISASRDKTLVAWQVDYDLAGAFKSARPLKSFVGHNHFVSDATLTEDGKYALSASHDGTLCLWEIETGKLVRKFISHKKDITCLGISDDNRFIISGSRDNSVKLWNVLGDCKQTFSGPCEGNVNWISSVHCVNFGEKKCVLATSWNGSVDIWELETGLLLNSRVFGVGPIITAAVTSDSMVFAVGGKNGKIEMMAIDDFEDLEVNPMEYESNDPLVALAFSPTELWLAVAYQDKVVVHDLEKGEVVQELQLEVDNYTNAKQPTRVAKCVGGLEWSSDGKNLFAAFDDNSIRVWSKEDKR